MSEGAAARATAARVLARVLGEGRSLTDALAAPARLPARDAALAQEIAYGVLRWHPRLAFLLARLLDKPLKAKDRDLEALLLAGLYQLAFLEVPPHAAVSATVAATTLLDKGWARGLANAVLRRFQREAAALTAAADGDAEAASAHPAWLLERLQADWPQAWPALVAANNTRPPMTLRVNRRRGDREGYLARLAAAGIEAAATAHAPDGVVLAAPMAVERLPGFAEGDVSVQDEAAQLAALMVAAEPGMRLLDACAAPGGKTGHLLEAYPGTEVLALDRDPARLARVDGNLARLGLAGRSLTGDAGEPAAWWDGRLFQRILLDAPCSGTGVIRRHPDIKLLRRPTDIATLAAEQARLLQALWPLLDTGGMLIYSTCSVLQDENRRQIEAFLAAEPQARAVPIEAAWGAPSGPGRQILPGQDGMDGFFYAGLAKG